MVEKKVVVRVHMSRGAIEAIEALKTKMNVSTESEVIWRAITLLVAVEEARNTSGNIVIQSKRLIPGPDKVIDLPWD